MQLSKVDLKPRVSVVMPFRSAEATLRECIESIRSQTMPSWELIAVDDGSVDGGRSILENLNDPRIKVFPNPEKGIVAALNYGISKSSSGLIARMDADDIAFPKRLEKQLDFLSNNPVIGLCASKVEHFCKDDELNSTGMSEYVDWINDICTPEEISENRFVESVLPHPSVVFRKELVDKFGGYREGGFPEDYEMWLRWLDAGVKMAKAPDILLKWRDSGDRLSRTDPRYSRDAFFRLKARYLAAFLEKRKVEKVWIWGAGRISRKKAAHLEEFGVSIEGYIDLNEKNNLPVHCISYKDIPERGKIYILSYVSVRGARELIVNFLKEKGYEPVTDFMMVS